jgi:hypothetical protein
MGRPQGATNKLKPSTVEDVLQERGVSLVHAALDLFNMTDDDKVKAQIIKMLMEYQYAKRRPEDQNGKTDELSIAPIVLSPEAAVELLKAARAK